MYNVLLSWSHWVQLERNGREGVRIRDYNNNVFWLKCFNINKPFNFNINTKLNMNKTYNFNIKNSLNMKKPYNLNKNKTYNF